jgi:2'-5' RNA ligase
MRVFQLRWISALPKFWGFRPFPEFRVIIRPIMTTIRTFIAIELSPEAQEALTNLQNRLKTIVPPNTVRWTAAQNIHLTLHFLGNITPTDVAKVSEVIQTCAPAYQAFSLTLSGLGCFPNTRRPRIIWAGISGDTGSLVKLHQDLGQRLKVIEFSPDNRPYSPHLTIGRLKRGTPPRRLTQLGEAIEQTKTDVGNLAIQGVTKVSLIKSELKPSGPVYTQLAGGVLKSPW